MEINFFEPEQMPQPRDKVKIESLTAEPYPDGRRIRVTVKMTPFQERPNLIISALSAAGSSLGSLEVLEAMTKQIQMTFHLRGAAPTGTVTLRAQLYYEEAPPQHQTEVTFDVPSSQTQDG